MFSSRVAAQILANFDSPLPRHGKLDNFDVLAIALHFK